LRYSALLLHRKVQKDLVESNFKHGPSYQTDDGVNHEVEGEVFHQFSFFTEHPVDLKAQNESKN